MSPRRIILVTTLSAMSALIAAITTAVILNSRRTDSGVTACQSMTGQSAMEPSKGTITRGEYLALRATFKDSRFVEIREPGMSLVNALWAIQSSPDQAMAFALFGSVVAAYGELSAGCAKHGVTLPTMESIMQGPPEPVPTQPSSPPADVMDRCRAAYESGDIATYNGMGCNRYGN